MGVPTLKSPDRNEGSGTLPGVSPSRHCSVRRGGLGDPFAAPTVRLCQESLLDGIEGRKVPVQTREGTHVSSPPSKDRSGCIPFPDDGDPPTRPRVSSAVTPTPGRHLPVTPHLLSDSSRDSWWSLGPSWGILLPTFRHRWVSSGSVTNTTRVSGPWVASVTSVILDGGLVRTLRCGPPVLPATGSEE